MKTAEEMSKLSNGKYPSSIDYEVDSILRSMEDTILKYAVPIRAKFYIFSDIYDEKIDKIVKESLINIGYKVEKSIPNCFKVSWS